MKCKYCDNNVQEWRYLDKLNICNKCRSKISNELVEILNKKIYNINEIENIQIVENLYNNDYKEICYSIKYKELYFYIYKCKNCNKLYIKLDHPSRLFYQIKENSNIDIFCSNECQLYYVRYKNSLPGKCKQCGTYCENRIPSGLGIDCGCANKNTKKMLYINTNPGICTNPDCRKYSEKRDAVGHCLDCSKKQLKDNKLSGNCTICGVYNKFRDQNGRGKDGLKNGGCDCSKNFFIEHNNSPNMLKISSLIGKKFGKFNLKSNFITYKFCSCCDKETPHKLNQESNELYCQVCAGEKVWCKKHQIFESISYNSDPSHGIFYKSKTKNWIQNYYEQFNYIQLLIDFKDNILDSETVRGIYLWRIDDVPYYCGDSNDILSRSYDHMYEIWNSPEYWLNIKDESVNKDHTISLEILQVCDNSISDQEMHDRQIKFINTVKPVSQKCDGTDHIIPLNQRKFNINNLKENI